MANSKKKVVRRIKADAKPNQASSRKAEDDSVDKTVTVAKVAKTTPSSAKADVKTEKAVTKTNRGNDNKKTKTPKVKSNRKPFILFRPFYAIGRYIRDSWRELMKVQWPNRRATWKMTLGVIMFCVIVGIFVLICDWVSQWLMKEVIL